MNSSPGEESIVSHSRPHDTDSIATLTWYNARASKSPSEYKNGAVTFYFAELERARNQKELPYSER